MKKLSVYVSSLVFGLFLTGTVFAQDDMTQEEESSAPAVSAPAPVAESGDMEGFNKYSVRPIHESDIMYRKTLLRALDLREKQNRPIFSKSKEITKLLIEAVRRGEITPYATDSLRDGRKLTITEFDDAMRIPSSLDTMALYDMYGPEWKLNPEVAPMLASQFFFPQDLYQMQIKEDLVFDKQRSRMYYDIHAITMLVPADHPQNVKGIEIPVASFEYKELVEKIFTDNPNAIWYNPRNDSEHRSLADAFELRLFSSYIIRVSNPMNAYLVDIYGGDQQKGILASQWAAFELLEYEHNLWEF